MNPFQMLAGMKNPQQMVQAMMNNSQLAQNPLMKNALEMYRNGNTQGLQQMAENLAKERGTTVNDVKNSIMQQFGM